MNYTKIARTPNYEPLNIIEKPEDVSLCKSIISAVFSFSSQTQFYKVSEMTEEIRLSFYFKVGDRIHSEDYSVMLAQAPHKIRNYYSTAEKIENEYYQILVVFMSKHISTDIHVRVNTTTEYTTIYRGYKYPVTNEFTTKQHWTQDELHGRVNDNNFPHRNELKRRKAERN